MAVLKPGARWRYTAALLAALLLEAGAAHAQPLEYAVKANYLYKFAPFVEWPAAAFAGAAAAFNVCVLGAAPFGASLDQATRGQRVGSHPVRVRRLRSVSPEEGCHVLYIGRSEGQSPSDAMAALRGQPVLIVTDANEGVRGGMIHFVIRDGRVRFSINPDSAKAHGLAISSKLLSLAVEIREGGD